MGGGVGGGRWRPGGGQVVGGLGGPGRVGGRRAGWGQAAAAAAAAPPKRNGPESRPGTTPPTMKTSRLAELGEPGMHPLFVKVRGRLIRREGPRLARFQRAWPSRQTAKPPLTPPSKPPSQPSRPIKPAPPQKPAISALLPAEPLPIPLPNPPIPPSKRTHPPTHPPKNKAAVTMAMDRRDRERELVSALLTALHPGTLSDSEVWGWGGAWGAWGGAGGMRVLP